ncbi:hypothetical protein I7I48_00520 [Histoplasma ohiense]|nr:hypothetical protein I7I48_00520 [Histoplasma ohiense (nom. inval.)]
MMICGNISSSMCCVKNPGRSCNGNWNGLSFGQWTCHFPAVLEMVYTYAMSASWNNIFLRSWEVD